MYFNISISNIFIVIFVILQARLYLQIYSELSWLKLEVK